MRSPFCLILSYYRHELAHTYHHSYTFASNFGYRDESHEHQAQGIADDSIGTINFGGRGFNCNY